MPSIEAMLITLAGLSAVAAARSGAASALVRKNGVLRLRFITLSQPLSGNSSKSAPHAAPGIVDENVQLRLALLDLGRQHVDAGHGGNVDRQRDAFAAIFRREFVRGRLARSGLARGDVNLRSALG